ncbi:MAG TPA: DnaJ domain-containing protein [Vicinamibacteria bacterium]|nr:DnaJ domain-containing protein [Vicinamibacteria bacterium]
MPSNAAARGTLSEGALARLIGRLQREKLSGSLRVSAMEVRGGVPVVLRALLRVAGGRLVALEEGGPDRAPSPPSADSTGELAARAAAMLGHLLAGRDGVYLWEEEPGSPAPAAGAPWVGEVARPAASALADSGLVRAALGPLDRTVVATAAGASGVGELSAPQAALLGRAAAGAPAAELCAHARDPEAAERDLLVLLCLGLVSWEADLPKAPPPPAAARPRASPSSATAKAPPPPKTVPAAPAPESVADRRRDIERAHAALRGANHFEVLGLAPDASEGDVRQAFARLARRYHPDAQRDPGIEDVRGKLADLFVAIGRAHDVLKDRAARERYERAMGLGAGAPLRRAPAAPPPPLGVQGADDPLEARILRSEEALAASQPWEAIRLLEEAVPAATGSLKTRARVLLGRAYVERERPREAEKVLLAALGDDPRSVPACLALGRLYRDRGMANRARGMFQKALEIDPRQAEARRELAGLGTAPPEGEGGGSLLSRLRDRR